MKKRRTVKDLKIIHEISTHCERVIIKYTGKGYNFNYYELENETVTTLSLSDLPDDEEDFPGILVSFLLQLKGLRKLQLISCCIEDMSQFRQLTQLTSLSFTSDIATDISWIASLKNLEELYLAGRKIEDLTSLAACRKLRSFDCRSIGKEKSIDFSSLGSLLELQSINIQDTPMKDISFLRNLKQLKELTLHNNGLKNVSLIGKITSLEGLTISGNMIRSISALAPLTGLEVLDVEQNPIKDISVISNFKKLKLLDISFTKVKELTGIDQLDQLEEFYFAECPDVDLSHLGDRKKLKKLSLYDSGIKDISFVSSLIHLEDLSLEGNLITNISALKRLSGLKSLDLSNNKIRNIDILSHLTHLQELLLDHNKISDITPLAGLVRLTHLILENNQLKDLTPLSGLTNLKTLNVADNSVADLSPVKDLILLEDLEASNNFFTDIEPLGVLKSLRRLNLSGNKIEDIQALHFLSAFSHIDIRNNLITRLPSWTSSYRLELKDSGVSFSNQIDLGGNPLIDPPVEIIEMGNDAVFRYFERKRREKFSALKEAKLILVGDGAAGKTSLRERLLDTKAALPEGDKRTRGIDVRDWVFKKNFVAHIWDFGGQDVYYPVHRFFMTGNAVFVLLASTRTEQHNFEYWIPTIFQFGGKSPIIVGQTCHEGNAVPWNDLGRYISHPDFNIIRPVENNSYFELNLPRRNKGLKTIREEIMHQLARLPHCCKKIPHSWIQVREELQMKSTKVACIPFDMFKAICKEVAPELFIVPDDYTDCAHFLHNTGFILWYSANPVLQDWMILQPGWSMEAVYKIIDDTRIQENRGHIVTGDFVRLWKGSRYEGRHHLLKQMLEVFRVAFPKKDKEEEYIIPARLISFPDEKRWKGEDFLRIEYLYDFMPRGLLNQLSAELSHYISTGSDGNEEVWNNAVNFSHDGSHCQMEEDFYKRKIVLRAIGKNARGLLMVIMHALNQINRQYKGIKPQIFVPCTCKECLKNENGTRFEYSKLLKWEAAGRTDVYCNESGEPLLIDTLLHDAGLSSPPTIPISMRGNIREIVIFLASSSELEIERREFEIFINRENKESIQQGIFFRLEIWEDFLDCISATRLQDEYNVAVRNCDIFVSLFWTKVGKYTKEEFETAYGQFISSGSPAIYTYFKNEAVPMDQLRRDDFLSLDNFKQQLREAGHFITPFENIEGLKLHFKKQLGKLITGLKHKR